MEHHHLPPPAFRARLADEAEQRNRLASPLLRLPPELRNRITEYAVTEIAPITVSSRRRLDESRQPALTRVCRQLRRETVETFYQVNDFEYLLCGAEALMALRLNWYNSMPPAIRSRLTFLSFLLTRIFDAALRPDLTPWLWVVYGDTPFSVPGYIPRRDEYIGRDPRPVRER